MVSEISKEDMDLCVRIDSLLRKAQVNTKAMYELASENEKIFKYAFAARAIVRELIEPKAEIFEMINTIEKELTEYVNQIRDNSQDEEFSNSEDEDK